VAGGGPRLGIWAVRVGAEARAAHRRHRRPHQRAGAERAASRSMIRRRSSSNRRSRFKPDARTGSRIRSSASRSSPRTSRTTLRTPINNLLGEAQVALSRPAGSCRITARCSNPPSRNTNASRACSRTCSFSARADKRAGAAPRRSGSTCARRWERFFPTTSCSRRSATSASRSKVRAQKGGEPRALGGRADAQPGGGKSSLQRVAPRPPGTARSP